MESNVQIFDYNGSQITFNRGESVMVNATEMAKPFGKSPSHWLRNQASQDFINAYCALRNCKADNLIVTINGDNGGTWMHEDVAIEFARWLAPSFAIWMNDRIKELLTKGTVSLQDDEMLILSKGLQICKRKLDESEAQVKQLTATNDILANQNRALEDQNRQMLPKAEYCEQVIMSIDGLTFTQVAKDLGMTSAKKLEAELEARRIIYRQSGQWLPFAKYSEKGYFTFRTSVYQDRNTGETKTKMYTIITELGRAWMHKLFDVKKEEKKNQPAVIPAVTQGVMFI